MLGSRQTLISCAISAGNTAQPPPLTVIPSDANSAERDSHFRQNLAVFDNKQSLTTRLIESRFPSSHQQQKHLRFVVGGSLRGRPFRGGQKGRLSAASTVRVSN